MKSQLDNLWEARKEEAFNVYGSYVDLEEEFYLCPECGEPVYKQDWKAEDFKQFICPICEFTGED